MNAKQIAIEGFSRFMLGGVVWARIKHIVSLIDDSTLSNKAKQAAAYDDARTIGIEIGGFLLNLGIELAVAFIRSKEGDNAS